MADPTASEIADRALDLGLLDQRQLQEVWASFGSHDVSLTDFVQHLVRKEFVTNYQVDRLVTGERSGFFFGDYKVLYPVGSGTFAQVYRAVHKDTNHVVAVKVLRERFSENPKQAALFVREGNLGRALRHPNIVAIREVHSHGTTHFLVMEFVEGWNLRSLMKIRKKMDPAEATRLTVGITNGLRHAFERGMTHRDLKMSNVLVSSRGEPKLVDFGLASIDDKSADDVDDLTGNRAIDYAALERATGVGRDDTRSDIYFLGCMYYHMLIGSPPLPETADRLQRLSRGRFQDVVPIEDLDPSIPHAVTAVVNKAMSLDATHRYQTPTDMLRDLAIAARHLSLANHEDEEEAERQRERERLAAELKKQKQQPSVMVVESSARMQDVYRSGLRRAGYRVLVLSDPQMALQRFRDEAGTADCVVLSAQEIGRAALAAFNVFGDDRRLESVPVILLIDKTQKHLLEEVSPSGHRIVLSMPITMKQLRAELAKLAPAPANSL